MRVCASKQSLQEQARAAKRAISLGDRDASSLLEKLCPAGGAGDAEPILYSPSELVRYIENLEQGINNATLPLVDGSAFFPGELLDKRPVTLSSQQSSLLATSLAPLFPSEHVELPFSVQRAKRLKLCSSFVTSTVWRSTRSSFVTFLFNDGSTKTELPAQVLAFYELTVKLRPKASDSKVVPGDSLLARAQRLLAKGRIREPPLV